MKIFWIIMVMKYCLKWFNLGKLQQKLTGRLALTTLY